MTLENAQTGKCKSEDERIKVSAKYPASLSILGLVIIALVGLGGCGDSIQRDIATIVEGGEGVQEAKMNVNLAKGAATVPLIGALQNKSFPPRARADIVAALYRLYVREADPRIWTVLIEGLADDEPSVRTAVVRALGDLRREEATAPLVDRLDRETNDVVRGEILSSLEVMANTRDDDMWNQISTDKFTDEEKVGFAAVLGRMTGDAVPDTLRRQALDWLEVLAEEKVVEARTLMLKGDLDEAESLLLAALELVPDSKNVNHALARFYFDNGDSLKGLSTLQGWGLLVRVPELKSRPAIDGIVEEPGWQGVDPITYFYQCIHRMRAYPIRGRSEAYIGHRANTIYVCIRGYGESVDLVAETVERDMLQLPRDDCVELFFDTNRDYRSYYQILVNSIGTLLDLHHTGDNGFDQAIKWNGNFDIATDVQGDYWTAEMAIPVAELGNASIVKGDIWGFNVARVRIPAAEYGQWAPTYGSAQRPQRFGFLVFD